MIDLASHIRTFLLSDATFSNYIANYLNSKAIFTERPVPTSSLYPLVIVDSVPVTTREADFLDTKKRIITYDILIIGENTDVTKNTAVKNAAFRAANILDRTKITAPSGWQIIDTKTRGPFQGPQSDMTKTIRVVSVEITVHQV